MEEIVKKANRKEKYTQKQLEQLINCSDPDEGYMYFAKHFCFIQHPVKGRLLFNPFEFQERLLNSYHKYNYSCNLLPRQSGKTTCAAIYLLWYTMFNPDRTVLVAAHKFSGAQEIMQRIRYIYESCPNHIRAGVTNYNRTSIEFENNSRIISTTTTESTGRGMSISLLYCDEMAFLKPNIASSFWTSISPTLSTGGRAIITSTPNTDDDLFAQIWRDAEARFDEYGNESEVGINGFHAFRAYWWEHPDRDDDWKKIEIGKIGEERFDREFNCEFITYEETLLNSRKLANMPGKDPEYKTGQVRWYKKPSSEYSYVVALDPSMGTGGDFAAVQVFELPTYDQVAEWNHNTTAIPGQVRILKDICNHISECCNNSFDNIYWSVENNSLGEACLLVINDFGEEHIPGLLISEPIRKGHVRKYRKGFNTTHASKVTACSKMKVMIERDKMKICSKPLISELKNFVASGGSYKARHGSTDDLISALLLIIRMITVIRDWDPRIYSTFVQIESGAEELETPLPFYVSGMSY